MTDGPLTEVNCSTITSHRA